MVDLTAPLQNQKGYTLPALPRDRTALFDRPDLNVKLAKGVDNNFNSADTEKLDDVETDEEDDLKNKPQEAELDLDWQTDGTICRAPNTKKIKASSDSEASKEAKPVIKSDKDKKECIEFRQHGRCHYGDRCKFSHKLTEEQAQQLKAKWTYVSLQTAPKGTDKANALGFLQELRHRKEKEQLEAARKAMGTTSMDVDEDSGSNGPKKMVYMNTNQRATFDSYMGGADDTKDKKESSIGKPKIPPRPKKRPVMCMDDDDEMD